MSSQVFRLFNSDEEKSIRRKRQLDKCMSSEDTIVRKHKHRQLILKSNDYPMSVKEISMVQTKHNKAANETSPSGTDT